MLLTRCILQALFKSVSASHERDAMLAVRARENCLSMTHVRSQAASHTLLLKSSVVADL